MSIRTEADSSVLQDPRYSRVHQQKSTGATYTPEGLASFVAEQMIRAAKLPKLGTIRVLDPAVGDGALLDALINHMPLSTRSRVEVLGYDTDLAALNAASLRLHQNFPGLAIHLDQKDFLHHVLKQQDQGDLSSKEKIDDSFHLVIANPPYVRTQIMGAQQAQQLARNFGLTGRVDLYYPFLLGISEILAPGGVTGVITSNRFMTTKSGRAVRQALLSRFEILHLWDLGDTKLFDAAVLPSIMLARGIANAISPDTSGIEFSSIYESEGTANTGANDIFSAFNASDDAVVSLPDGRRYRVRHGRLENGGVSDGPWRVGTQATNQWLATVTENTWATFRRIGKIRVGVKSTADDVFVRSDWDAVPEGRPELLRPLITRHWARRFRAATPVKSKHIKEILYPHEVTDNGRVPIDLSFYPKAARYLERHRAVLEARKYVIDAGRKWYELWVPQDPDAWSLPKLVFPDISDSPIFWIDKDGGVVNGECYWLRCENEDEEDLLWLALAVANSTFIETFYDHRFVNKLYAGRRRFITQYVEQFPLPNPSLEGSKAIIDITKTIYALLPSTEAVDLASQLDARVWSAFGLAIEEASR